MRISNPTVETLRATRRTAFVQSSIHMGFLFILPLAALFLWILGSTYRALGRMDVPPAWWKKAWLSLAVGAGLGVWFAFFTNYHPSPTVRLEGFPIPLVIHRFADGKWTDTPLPQVERTASLLVDLLAGLALAWLPLKLACVLREFRRQSEAAKQTAPKA